MINLSKDFTQTEDHHFTAQEAELVLSLRSALFLKFYMPTC